MPLSDQGRAALEYWAQIQQAASARGNVAGAFDLINAAREAGTVRQVPVTLLGVQEVYSAAAQIRNGSEGFAAGRELGAATGINQVITSDMMALDITARAGEAISAFTDYYVRVEAQYTTPLGQAASVYLTARYDSASMPQTINDLIDGLSSWAPSSGSLPVGTFAGIGAVSITAA